MIIRWLARVLLAAVFVTGGVDTLRNPEPRVKRAAPFIDEAVEGVKDKLPKQVPTDPATLVRIDAAIKVVAGIGLAFGKFPRFSALVLAVAMVPTTLAGHAFWEDEEPSVRSSQQVHFTKNISLIGGLLFAATEPRRKARAKRSGESGTGVTKGELRAAATVAANKAVNASPSKRRRAA